MTIDDLRQWDLDFLSLSTTELMQLAAMVFRDRWHATELAMCGRSEAGAHERRRVAMRAAEKHARRPLRV